MDLNLIHLVFTLKLEADTADRYALFGLRPYFTESFREGSGCGSASDKHCTRGDECLFHQTFSQHLSADPAALRRYQKPSLPFVFRIPVLPSTPNRGSVVELGLVLAGSAMNFVTYYIAALEGVLQRSDFRRRMAASLMKTESIGYDGNRTLIMEPGKGTDRGLISTLSLEGLRESAVFAPDTVKVSIVTPMQIMIKGKPLTKFSFSPFIRALFRRVSSMAYYYGGGEEGHDYKWLAGQSLLVECTEAEFRWVEWGGKLSGIVGWGTFQGDLADFHPFLSAGEYLHVGKGASFGLGRFELIRE